MILLSASSVIRRTFWYVRNSASINVNSYIARECLVHDRACAIYVQGEHLDLRQRPLQVKYIKDSLEEDKSIVLYLCKE